MDDKISITVERKKSIYEMQAEICKILSSPKRIEIIAALKEGEKSVTELVDILGIPKANVSQHLAIMRLKGILKARREGVNIYYCINNQKVVQACNLMKEVLSDILAEGNKMASLIDLS